MIGRFVGGDAPSLPPSLARRRSRRRRQEPQEIAQELEVPLATVRTCGRRIYARLGVHNSVELATRWRARR